MLAYVEREDSPRPLNYQLDLMREVGFREVEILHKNVCFAAYGGGAGNRRLLLVRFFVREISKNSGGKEDADSLVLIPFLSFCGKRKKAGRVFQAVKNGL